MLMRTGTMLSASAKSHADSLEAVLADYDCDTDDLRGFVTRKWLELPRVNIVHSDPVPTRVVTMQMDDTRIKELTRELTLRAKVEAALRCVAAGTYSPLSLQFENSILFLPSAHKFFKSNESIAREIFPEIETIVVNAFFVPAGTRPYGCHNAGSIAFQRADLAVEGHAFPYRHLSFHTAVTPTPLSRQPLVVFEDARVESPNTAYMYAALARLDLSRERAYPIEKAYYLHDTGRLREMDVVTVRDYMLGRYWESWYGTEVTDVPGYYADLQPGQAIVFDNYRPHGDSTLSPSSADRITIDMRCFSKVSYPNGNLTSGVGLYSLDLKKKLRQKRLSLDCILRVIGYSDTEYFLDTVYGTKRGRVDPFEILTDLQLGIYNRSENHLLDQNLDAHYERVHTLYEEIERRGEYVAPREVVEMVSEVSN